MQISIDVAWEMINFWMLSDRLGYEYSLIFMVA